MASWLTSKVKGFFSGIVDGVKNVLGIASPSKVFASIGGYMAEGLGEGWDDEYGRISKNIKSGLDFGTATVDFASSGLGMSSASIGAKLYGGAISSSEPITIIVQSVLDGKVIGETSYRYMKDKERAYGLV